MLAYLLPSFFLELWELIPGLMAVVILSSHLLTFYYQSGCPGVASVGAMSMLVKPVCDGGGMVGAIQMLGG
jgi:hypothetical protein